MDQVDMEQKILRNLRESVMEEMDFSSEISDEKLFARIDYALMRESRKRLLSIEERHGVDLSGARRAAEPLGPDF